MNEDGKKFGDEYFAGRKCSGSLNTSLALFGPDETCYTIDAKRIGNIGRYIKCECECVLLIKQFSFHSARVSRKFLCKAFSWIHKICAFHGWDSFLIST